MSKVRTFIGILKLELQDAADDAAVMIEAALMKQAEGTYTEYVKRENTALYQCEIDSLRDLVHEIAEREDTDFASVDEAVKALSELVPAKIKDWNYPGLMAGLLDRKMEKARKYLETGA